jgi:capsular polysaccharide biosynthesis protein
MSSVPWPDSFELADYTGLLRRRWLVIVAFAVVGLVGAFAYVTVAPKTYTSTAAVYVAATGADQGNQIANSRTGGQVNLDTEAQFVTSGTVATIAARQLHSPLKPWALSKQVTVLVPPNSEILDISCNASSAQAAADCANAFASAYLQNRSASATTALTSQVSKLTAKLNPLQKTVSGLKAKITGLSANSPTRLTDESLVSTDAGQMHALAARIATLQGLAADNSGGHIISSANPPGKPSSPKKSLVLPSGLVVGLIIGLILALIWDRRDKRIRAARDVERFLDFPVMLSLPQESFGQGVSLASPRSRSGRAFTELGHTVAATLGDGNHVLFVTGASSGPAGSVVAANLAATLAMTHPEVVLICADLTGSVAPEMLGLAGGPGLAEVVAGEVSMREVVRTPGVPGLWVLTPGSKEALPGYYIEHNRARAVITQLRRDARYVIIEAQSVDDVADMFAFAEFADAAMIVVEAPRTRREEAAECARRLQRLRTTVIGVAVLPYLGKRVRVRPLRPGLLQSGGGDNRAGAATERTELPAMSGKSITAQDPRRAGAARSAPDFQDNGADRVHRS